MRLIHEAARRLVIGAAAAAAAVVLAACSSSSGGAESSGEFAQRILAIDAPESVAATTASTTDGLVFPIQAYMPTREQRTVVSNAQQRVVGECMARFGFDWDELVFGGRDVDLTTRLYGITDLAAAGIYGYHPPEVVDVITGMAPPLPPQPELTAAEFMVLRGSDTGIPDAGPADGTRTYAGQAVPRGGCTGEAARAVTGVDDIDPDLVADALHSAMFNKSHQDARVQAVIASWSACVAASGYTAADPLQVIGDPKWATPLPSAEEISAAVVDMQCKAQTNLMGVWFSVESAYEQQAIQIGIERLTEVMSRWDEAAAKAASILGVPAPQPS